MQDYSLLQEKKFLMILKSKYFWQKNPKPGSESETQKEPEPAVFATLKTTKE